MLWISTIRFRHNCWFLWWQGFIPMVGNDPCHWIHYPSLETVVILHFLAFLFQNPLSSPFFACFCVSNITFFHCFYDFHLLPAILWLYFSSEFSPISVPCLLILFPFFLAIDSLQMLLERQLVFLPPLIFSSLFFHIFLFFFFWEFGFLQDVLSSSVLICVDSKRL